MSDRDPKTTDRDSELRAYANKLMRKQRDARIEAMLSAHGTDGDELMEWIKERLSDE